MTIVISEAETHVIWDLMKAESLSIEEYNLFQSYLSY